MKVDKTLSKDIDNLYKKRGVLVLYLKENVTSGDWHAVADAAMDIREIDSAIKALKYSRSFYGVPNE